MRLRQFPVALVAQGGEMRFFGAALFAQGDNGAFSCCGAVLSATRAIVSAWRPLAARRTRLAAGVGGERGGVSASGRFAGLRSRNGFRTYRFSGGDGVMSAFQEIAANPARSTRRGNLRPAFALRRDRNRCSLCRTAPRGGRRSRAAFGRSRGRPRMAAARRIVAANNFLFRGGYRNRQRHAVASRCPRRKDGSRGQYRGC